MKKIKHIIKTFLGIYEPPPGPSCDRRKEECPAGMDFYTYMRLHKKLCDPFVTAIKKNIDKYG